MPEIDDVRRELENKRREQAQKEGDLTQLRGRLRQLDAQVEMLRRTGLQEGQPGRTDSERRLLEESKRVTDGINTLREDIRKTRSSIKDLDPGRATTPSEVAIGLFSDSLPILLFPVRIETKFIRDEQSIPRQLWVRVYPDDIAIETHEPLLTPEEFEAGAQYFRDIWPALPDPVPNDWRQIFRGAWRRLVEAFGPERGAWILRVIEDENFVLNVKSVIDEPRRTLTDTTPLFEVTFDPALQTDLNNKTVPASWTSEFADVGFPLSGTEQVSEVQAGSEWQIHDPESQRIYRVAHRASQLGVSIVDEPRFKVESRQLFEVAFVSALQNDLDNETVPLAWAQEFTNQGLPLSDNVRVRLALAGELWEINDIGKRQTYQVMRRSDRLVISAIDPPRFKPTEDVPVRPESWSEAARSYVMPDRFVVRLYRAREDASDEATQSGVTHVLVRQEEGAPIPHPLHVGPAPFPVEQETAQGSGDGDEDTPEQVPDFFDEESKWIENFDRAVDVGMGFRIDLTDEDRQKGYFSRVVVLGIKSSMNADQSAEIVDRLVGSHQYTEGFAFVRQGTPTNNTSEAQAGYASNEAGGDGSFERVHGPPLSAADTWRDGPRVASALGIPVSAFAHTHRANETEDRNAQRMLGALWSATWGYYFGAMMNGVLPANDINALRSHFIRFVHGRGPYPAIRVGNMPYGILPVMGLKQDMPPEDTQASEPFDRMLRRFLLRLYPKWLAMATDADAVPRAGGSNDPDKEFIEILGMEASGRHVHVRSIISELYLWNLLRFLQPTLFNPGFPSSLISRLQSLIPRTRLGTASAADGKARQGIVLGDTYLKNWWERFEASKEQSRTLFRQLVPESGSQDYEWPQILNTIPWNPAPPFDGPLVTDDPLSEEYSLEGSPADAGDTKTNYITWLKEQDLATIRDDETAGEQSNSLLFQLLRRSILLEGTSIFGNARPSQDWLDDLARLPTAELERLLIESLDVSSHRLDAWITSLAARRLVSLRAHVPQGIQLGAFGWVEDVKPREKPGGGFIHAPSISHAATAAVLRSAYLTHANGENAGVMAVNLTSERVRRSLWLLQGIREGQELGALLGYRFERGLHDRSGGPDGLELDQYISAFRRLYPLKVVERPDDQAEEDDAAEAVAARTVVDGRKLLENRENIPFGKQGLPPGPSRWPWAGPAREYDAIQEVLNSLEDSLDALGDLALAESVYQPVQGNYQRAGALLDTLAGSGRPPEPEVVATPRSGINLKHRVAMLFTGNAMPANAWPQTPRGAAEPYLNGWAGQLLGDPTKIKCTLRFPSSSTTGTGSVEQTKVLSLKDLGLGPLDFLHLSQFPATGEATELEERIAYHIRRPWVHMVVSLHGRPTNRPASMPVLDNTSSYPGGALETFSWPHTIGTNEDALLIVGLSLNQAAAFGRSVKFGDRPLQKLGRHINAERDSVRVEIWYLLAPPVGTSDISVTLNMAQHAVAGAASFSQMDMNNPIGTASVIRDYGIGNSITSTLVASTAGTVLLDVWSKLGSIGHHTAAEQQTKLWVGRVAAAANDDDNVQGGMSYAAPGEGDYTMRWILPFRVEFKRNDALDSDDVPMSTVLPLAREMQRLVANARALSPLDLQLPEEAAGPNEFAEPPDVSQQRAAERVPLYNLLKQRLVTANSNAPGAFESLTQVRDVLKDNSATDDSRRNALFEASYFGVQGAIRVDLSDQELDAQVANVSGQVSKRHKACQEALAAADAAFDNTDLARIEQATRHLVTGFKALFGEGFTVLPPFAPNNRDELALVLDGQNTAALLNGENERWPELWLQQVARVRPEIHRFESVAMLAQALSGKERLTLRVGQLPHGGSDRWLALPFKQNDDSELRQGTLSLVVHIPGQFSAGGEYAGLVLGDWDEIIPGDTETTAVAFNFNQPDAEPPQSILIAASPESGADQGVWTWDALVDCVESTLDLAKVRAVDLDALREFGRFLPALYAPISLV